MSGRDNVIEDSSLALTKRLPPDLLLIVFIHGFKGTDETFCAFPDRLQHVLKETIDNVLVECVVFPAYETKGDLAAAVERFADWLTTITVNKEVASGSGGGAGKAKIVLCGHSMGGLLAVDALVEMVKSRPDKSAPLWPRIVACIAFDTPYFGLHPFVFKNGATKAAEYVQTARDIASGLGLLGSLKAFGAKDPPKGDKAPVAAINAPPSSNETNGSPPSWSKWAPTMYGVGGVLLAGAAAGAAYWKKDDIGAGYAWWADHMKYVGNLWDEKALRGRVERAIEIEEELGVIFRTFYTIIPPTPPNHQSPRTFIILPKEGTTIGKHFIPAQNRLAVDEVTAHISMFEAKVNDGYYELGLATAQLIREAVIIGRGTIGQEEQEVLVAGKSEVLHSHAQSKAKEPDAEENLIDL